MRPTRNSTQAPAHCQHWGLACLLFLSAGCRAEPRQARADVPRTPALSAEAVRDSDIVYYTARYNRDPSGGMDLAHLGALLLQRSRETGDPRDAEAAERAARQSLKNRSVRNDGASQVLASSLLAQHKFTEALAIARRLHERDPENASLTATAGEIAMELGQYDSARAAFRGLSPYPVNLSVTPRLSRWAEIEGHPDSARALIRTALDAALKIPSIPAEQRAWFWLRAGDIEGRQGRPSAADSCYRTGLAAHPDDYRLQAALARSAASQGRWADAVSYGEAAMATVPDPGTLGVLADAYAALGRTEQAQSALKAMDVAVRGQPGAYHRAWSLFLLDHDRHVATVATKVAEELATRRDIYGLDLQAWSLHKRGRDRAALPFIHDARALGTQDALLYYHEGMIERALGHREAARAALSAALRINPYFSATEVPHARAALATLGDPS